MDSFLKSDVANQQRFQTEIISATRMSNVEYQFLLAITDSFSILYHRIYLDPKIQLNCILNLDYTLTKRWTQW